MKNRVDERNKVADCSKRHEIEIFPEIRVVPAVPESKITQFPPESDQEIKDDAHAGQMFKGKRAIMSVRVDYRLCIGQDVGNFMMVKYDDVDSQ